MPTIMEIVFWVCALIGVVWFLMTGLSQVERNEYVSDYELSRLNGLRH